MQLEYLAVAKVNMQDAINWVEEWEETWKVQTKQDNHESLLQDLKTTYLS